MTLRQSTKVCISYLLSMCLFLSSTPMAFAASPGQPDSASQFFAEFEGAGRQVVPGVTNPEGGEVYTEGKVERGLLRTYTIYNGEPVNGTVAQGAKEMVPEGGKWPEIVDPDPYRPSNLERRLEWTGESGRAQNVAIQSALTGSTVPAVDTRPGLIKRAWNATESTRQSVKSGAVFFGANALFMYSTLGIMAYYDVLVHHSSNPMAVAKYVSTLNDPVGYMSLAGFLAASAFFFNKYYKGLSKNGMLKQLPWFAGAMIAGSLVSNIVNEMGSEPDARKCMGLDKMTEIIQGSWFSRDRDMAACDRMWNIWKNNWKYGKYEKALVPSVAGLLVGSGIYLAASAGIGKLLAADRTGRVLRAIGSKLKIAGGTIAKTPKVGASASGGIWSFAITLGLFVGFMAANRLGDMFGLQNLISEELETRVSLAPWSNRYGNTPQQTMNKLAPEYARARDNQFRGAESRYFAELVSFLHIKLADWRKYRQGATNSAAQQWSEKVGAFQLSYNRSYDLYNETIQKIVYEQNNLREGKPLAKENTLSWIETLRYINVLRPDNILVVPISDLDIANPNKWPLVLDASDKILGDSQLTFGQFLVLSMACGPRAGTQAVDGGTWGIEFIRRTMGMEPTINFENNANMKPSAVFADQFIPPRIVDVVGDQTVCSRQYEKIFGTFAREFPLSLPFKNFRIMGPPDKNDSFETSRFDNIVDYIKAKISPEIIVDGKNMFPKWWKETVFKGQVEPAFNKFQEEYNGIINKVFRPVVYNKTYKCIGADNPPLKDDTFNSFLRVPECPGSQFGLAYGLLESIKQEITLHFEILLSVREYVFDRLLKPNATPAEKEEVEKKKDLWDEYFEQFNVLYKEAVDMIGEENTGAAFTEPTKIKELRERIGKLEKSMQEFLDKQMVKYDNEKLSKLGDPKFDQTLGLDARYRLTLERQDAVAQAGQFTIFVSTISLMFSTLNELVGYREKMNIVDPRNLDRGDKIPEPLVDAPPPPPPAPRTPTDPHLGQVEPLATAPPPAPSVPPTAPAPSAPGLADRLLQITPPGESVTRTDTPTDASTPKPTEDPDDD